MKVEVTRKGVYDQAGNKVAVGTEMDIKGDTVPGYLRNKVRVVPSKGQRAAVTNPAEGAVKQPVGEKA